MTVTERLMKPGKFNLELVPNAPRSVWQAVREFDHIVVTPTRLNDIATYSDTAITAAASYSGVVTGKPSVTSITGQGLGYWLGTDDGLGDVLITDVALSTANLATWLTSLLPSSIAVGTVTSPATTLSYVFRWVTRREAIDFVCRAVGAEWRINPNGTLDAGASLFVTTPNDIISRRGEGIDGSLTGINARTIGLSRNVDGYTTQVVVVGQVGDGTAADGSRVGTGTATGANVYKDFRNNNVVMRRLVNAPNSPNANLATYATNTLAQYSSVRREITIDSETYAVPRLAKPGDWLWVYDLEADVYDAANAVVWRGELINPIKLRVRSYTWPLEQGMGVYARRSGATPTYTDLTDFVRWETGAPTRWEVGSTKYDPDQNPEMMSPAYLGDNGTILGRVYDPPWLDYTVTPTNITGFAGTGRYRLRGENLELEIAVTAGTATAGGTIQLSLPGGFTNTGDTFQMNTMVSTSVVHGRVLAGGTTVIVYKTAAGGAWTAADSLTGVRVKGSIAV